MKSSQRWWPLRCFRLASAAVHSTVQAHGQYVYVLQACAADSRAEAAWTRHRECRGGAALRAVADRCASTLRPGHPRRAHHGIPGQDRSGLVIFRSRQRGRGAVMFMHSDPAVVAGLMTATVHPYAGRAAAQVTGGPHGHGRRGRIERRQRAVQRPRRSRAAAPTRRPSCGRSCEIVASERLHELASSPPAAGDRGASAPGRAAAASARAARTADGCPAACRPCPPRKPAAPPASSSLPCVASAENSTCSSSRAPCALR